MNDLRLCVVGNLLGRNPGYVTTQGQILADLFESHGSIVTSVSPRINRISRMVDIIYTILRNRRKFEVIVVEVYSGVGFVLADVVSLLGKYFSVPTVFVLHGGGLPEFMNKFPKWSLRVLKRADRIVTPSAFLANAVKQYDLSPRIIPNIIDLDDYRYRIRDKIGPKLMWMRSFHPTYNPLMALEVLKIVLRKRPDATLVMAGVDKGLESQTKDMALRMGLGHAIRFPGFLDTQAKVREFSDADIFLNTNNIDNMPVSIVEACAMGLPVIATKVGGLSDLITDGVEGILIPQNDASTMADAVFRLLDDPALTSKLSSNGRLLAERSSSAAIKKEWDDVFVSLLQKAQMSEMRNVPSASVY